MKKALAAGVVLLALWFVPVTTGVHGQTGSATATPTASVTPTGTPAATLTSTATVSPTGTAAATLIPAVTATTGPTSTATAATTGGTATPSATATSTPTAAATATSTPTPTATPVPPRADALLPSALLATLLKNSVHLDGTLRVSAPGSLPVTLTGTFTGKAAWTGTSRGTLTLKLPKALVGSGAASTTLLWKGNYLATKSGNGKWDCTNITKAVSATGTTSAAPLPTSVPGSTATAGLTTLPTLGTPKTLGSATIGGAPMWHVQIKSKPAKKGSKTASTDKITIDLYVNQADLTYRRVVIADTTTQQKTKLTLSVTLNLTQYGAPVTVNLPSACKGKLSAQLGVSALQRTLVQRMRVFADPSRLFAQFKGR